LRGGCEEGTPQAPGRPSPCARSCRDAARAEYRAWLRSRVNSLGAATGGRSVGRTGERSRGRICTPQDFRWAATSAALGSAGMAFHELAGRIRWVCRRLLDSCRRYLRHRICVLWLIRVLLDRSDRLCPNALFRFSPTLNHVDFEGTRFYCLSENVFNFGGEVVVCLFFEYRSTALPYAIQSQTGLRFL
jgi:hypothetical protein